MIIIHISQMVFKSYLVQVAKFHPPWPRLNPPQSRALPPKPTIISGNALKLDQQKKLFLVFSLLCCPLSLPSSLDCNFIRMPRAPDHPAPIPHTGFGYRNLFSFWQLMYIYMEESHSNSIKVM